MAECAVDEPQPKVVLSGVEAHAEELVIQPFQNSTRRRNQRRNTPSTLNPSVFSPQGGRRVSGEFGDRTAMACAAPRAMGEGQEGSQHSVLEHRMGNGGGTWPERGRLGDTETNSHRNHLRKGNFQTKLHLEHLEKKLELLGLNGDRGEKEKLCSWRKRTFLSSGPREDGGPTRTPIKEPVQEDREQTGHHLENLRKQKEELLQQKVSGQRRCQDFLMRTEAERQKIVSGFRQLRRLLKEQEVMLLAQLGELDRAVLRRHEEEEAKVEGDIGLLSVLICEMEEKLHQPTRGFLPVSYTHLDVYKRQEQEVMLLAQLGELDRAVLRRHEEQEAKVEGDIGLLSILICEMEEKLHQPTRGFLQKIRVSLDYDWGEVAFSDAENHVPIFAFPLTCFGGERLRPWFWVELGSLSLP
ncbi:UNVERIFIED_CONTAM: hypothetical protein H355_002411 [Colinus virginianus]|nr:hypothetical protein H355_002411 [Colinus virginianus]